MYLTKTDAEFDAETEHLIRERKQRARRAARFEEAFGPSRNVLPDAVSGYMPPYGAPGTPIFHISPDPLNTPNPLRPRGR